MISLLKRSGASDTASAHRLFNAARLKLTGLSVLVIALIILAFSFYIYQTVSSDIVDIGSQAPATDGGDFQQQFVDQTTASIVRSLAYADLAVLILAALLSFYFSGRILRPIRRASEAQRAFAENASHELRTPLAILKSDIETLARATHPPNELVHEIAASNLEEVDRMEHLVGNLLALARSQQPAVHGQERIDIAEAAGRLTEKFERIAQTQNIRLSCTRDASLIVDGTRDIERALMNLIQNALEHTPPGGAVSVSARREGARARIRVADTGSGIDANDLSHVFDRFYKGAGSHGSGLGLSLVKEVVERHGGTVTLASKLGQGTIVTLTLPLAS